VLQTLRNNHIVCVFGWTEWPGSMALVLEYMPGGNLTRFLDDADCNRSSMLLFLRVFFELSSGLAFIHNHHSEHRVVHGDLKPENALLTEDLHCKVGDFGSAQITSFTRSTTSEYTTSKKFDMTLAYASPEKLTSLSIRPKKEQDTYSFGMILFVILSGHHPYDNPGHERAFIDSIMRGERPAETSIHELRATLYEDKQQILDILQSIMSKCWAANPSHRPTMIQVRNQLQITLQLQNEEDVMSEATEMVRSMHLTIPREKEQTYRPLHDFVTRDERFIEGQFHIILQFSLIF